MKNFFQHLRRQPKAVRDSYALGFSVAFTLVVALVWFVSVNSSGRVTGEVLGEAEANQKPFATFIKQSKEQLASVMNIWKKDSEVEVDTDTDTENKESSNVLDIELTEEDLRLLEEKELENRDPVLIGTSTTENATYNEVLIGTTTEGR